MAFKHGKATTVLLGAVDLSPYLTSADLSADLDTADSTTFGATWKTSVAGSVGAKLDVGGLYDPGEGSLPALFLSLIPGVLTVCPGSGTAIGDPARMLSAYDAAYAESASVGGVVAVKAAFMATGIVGIGNVLHPLGEDTNTTTGAERDDSSSSATGWTAHLHVIAVDGGSWVIKLQDAAVSNTYSDVTGGAFAAATGATSERISSASTTTALRQYVRYVATRTGGSAGDGITFALAYSRN